MTEELDLVIQDEFLKAEADKLTNEHDDLEWLPEWYLGKLVEFEAREQAIRDNALGMINEIANKRKYLEWKWYLIFNGLITEKLKGKKEKSVKFLHGTAGNRTIAAKVKVVDEKKALKWCLKNCKEAIKTKITVLITPVKEMLLASGEEPEGFEIIPEDEKFYPERKETT